MKHNWTGYRKPTSSIWPATSAVAVVIAGGVCGGLWLRPTDGRAWQTLLPAAILAVTTVLVIAWQSRARARRRWKAALNAFAEEEITRARYRKAPKEVQKSW
jgi:hypothetical protein